VQLFWVDPTHSGPILDKFTKENIVVTTFTKSTDLLDHLSQNWLSLSSLKLVVASNRFRKDDGDENAGVQLCRTLRHHNSKFNTIPFVLYCGAPQSVRNEFPHRQDILLTNVSEDFIKFVETVHQKLNQSAQIPSSVSSPPPRSTFQIPSSPSSRTSSAHSSPTQTSKRVKADIKELVPGELIDMTPGNYKGSPGIFVINKVLWYALRFVYVDSGNIGTSIKLEEFASEDDAKKKRDQFISLSTNE